MKKEMKKGRVVFDLETTGLDISTCAIVQISILVLDDNFKIIDQFSSYIKPWRGAVWEDEAVVKTGITAETVENSPTFKELSSKIFDLLSNKDFITYNGNAFDIPFITEEFSRVGIELDLSQIQGFDVLKIEQLLTPRDLSSVYKKYTGKVLDNAHDAATDTKATLDVFLKQIDIMNTTELDDLSTNIPVAGMLMFKDGEYEIIFGKYKGTKLFDLFRDDKNYVTWMIKTAKQRQLFKVVQEQYNIWNKNQKKQ